MVATLTFNNGTTTWLTDTSSDSSATKGTWIMIETEKPKILPFFEKSIWLISGKIYKLWVDYYSVHMFWTAPQVVHKTGLLADKRFRRRFQGFNKGRHWDRKRR